MPIVRKRIRRKSRHLTYRAAPLRRHRIRVRWLLAQRTRVHNYLRNYRDPCGFQDTPIKED